MVAHSTGFSVGSSLNRAIAKVKASVMTITDSVQVSNPAGPIQRTRFHFGHSPFGVPGWSRRPSNCPASLGKQRSGPRPSPPVCLFTIAGSVFASLTTRKPIQNVGGADKERGNRVSLILPVASERRAVSMVVPELRGKQRKGALTRLPAYPSEQEEAGVPGILGKTGSISTRPRYRSDPETTAY